MACRTLVPSRHPRSVVVCAGVLGPRVPCRPSVGRWDSLVVIPVVVRAPVPEGPEWGLKGSAPVPARVLGEVVEEGHLSAGRPAARVGDARERV